MLEKKEGSPAEKLGRILESGYFVPAALIYGLICWFFKLTFFAVYGYLAAFLLILIFCENVKNVFVPVLYISYVIPDIVSDPHLVLYAVAVGTAYVSLFVFAIYRGLEKKKSGGRVVKGELFFPFILFSVALVLAGVIGNFNPLAAAITFGFCSVVLVLYFIALNFTKGLTDGLALTFLWGAAGLTLQVFLDAFLRSCKDFGPENFFAAQNVNVFAIMITLGIVSCFKLGAGKKTDAWYFLLSCVYYFGVLETCCRMMIAVATVLEIGVTVAFIVRSEKKTRFLYAGLCILAVAGCSFAFYDELIKPIVDRVIRKMTGSFWSGRDETFRFAIEKGREFPIFGYGFLAGEGDPSQREGILLIHNTVLQWICSLGYLGASLSVWFYASKYKVVFDKRNPQRTFTALYVLVIALSGITDQAASMDIFYFLLPLLLVAGAESEIAKSSASVSSSADSEASSSFVSSDAPSDVFSEGSGIPKRAESEK